MGMVRTSAVILISVAATLFVGCVTTHIGDQIDKDKLSKITKGVTTRAQVVELLGEPNQGSNDRMMIYTSAVGHSNNGDVMYQAIPVAGLFIPEHTSNSTRVQVLQIMLRDDGVVDDYKFTDNTSETDTNTSLIGGNVEQHTNTVPSNDDTK
jgi:hypothetical protein